MIISSSFVGIRFPFIIFAVFLVVPLCNGKDAKYKACSNLYSCGKIKNIGYPFWGGDSRPDFCGIQDFKLSCLTGDQFPTMNIYNNGYLGLSVLGVNTSLHTMSISRNKLLESCYVLDTSKITLLSTLKIGSSYDSISLFYGCSDCASGYPSKSFTCTNSDNHTNGSAYYFEDLANLSGTGKSCTCTNNVTVPVDKSRLDDLRSPNASLWDILTNQPVEMEYMANFTACSKCEESGGSCGSSDNYPTLNQFVCYCQDGPHPSVCSQSGGQKTLRILIGSGVAAFVLGTTMLVALFFYAYRRRRTNQFPFQLGDQNVAAFMKSYGSIAPKGYTYADIRKMTNYFKDKLGEGGYGSVYKGQLRDGRLVAVKKLKILEGDGKEFIGEVLSITRTNHVNIVTLLGYCFEGDKRALVFEFMPNGSLDKFICGKGNGQSLKPETMFNIAVGIARGLDYLHRGCNTQILHFDIKPHNILLDEDFRPKISDFGLARLCPPMNSMISMSEARGTVGYIAPEVFCRYYGSVSHKSDVYSYGMMLLDLVCGRNNRAFDAQHNSEVGFPEWIYKRLEPVEDVAAHRILNDDEKEMERKMIIVSLWCIQTYPSNRPPMNRVVEMLEGSVEFLQLPPKPTLSSPGKTVFDSSPMTSMSMEGEGRKE